MFNAGLPGIGVFQQARMIQAAIHQGTVQTIFWGLDFLDFVDSGHRDNPGWPRDPIRPNLRLPITSSGSLNGELEFQRLRDMRDAAFSIDALSDSASTLIMQADRNSATRTLAGFNPAKDYLKIIQSEGQAVLFEQKNRETLARLDRRDLSIFGPSAETSNDFESVRFILQLASESGIEIALFVNPYHAEYLIAIDLTDKWLMLEQWKLTLARLVAESGTGVLFDFNAFDGYSTERPPLSGVRGKGLHWYWEPAHYRKAFGELMLARMLGRNCGESSVSVGVELTMEVAETHLQELRLAKSEYKAAFADRIEVLKRYRDNR